MAQNDSEWPILPNSQLFQSFPTEVAQNDLEWPILPNLQLFQSFPTKVAQNDLEWSISPDSQLSNLFPPKWLRMTRNGQFCMAKIKYTLIQGNFYERLPFYMDSCALGPMASLLTKVCPPLNILAEYQQFCMKPTEQGLFFQAGRNESKEWYATIKTYKNVIISVVGISTVLHQIFRTGLIFPSRLK